MDRNARFQAELFADGRSRIGTSAKGDSPPASRLTAPEALVLNALFDGFIRY